MPATANLNVTLEAAVELIGVNVSQMLAAVVAECIVFGVYTSLFTGTLAVILRSLSRPHPKKLLLLAVCVAMYLSATAHLGISLYSLFENDRKSHDSQDIALACVASSGSSEIATSCTPIPKQLQAAVQARFGQVLFVLIAINILLSDAVVLWRALVLWPRRGLVMGISAVLMLGTIVLFVWNVIIYYQPGEVDTYVSTAAFLASWLTNLWATVLVACRTWQYRRLIKAHLGTNLRTRVEHTLLLFVESGILYCLFWAPLAVANIIVAGDWSESARLRALTRAGNTALHASGAERYTRAIDTLAASCFIDVVGMYPTAVILFVELSGRYAQRTLSVRDMPTLLSCTVPTRSPIADRAHVLHTVDRPVLQVCLQDPARSTPSVVGEIEKMRGASV